MDTAQSAIKKLDGIVRGARAILEHQSFAESARAIFDICRELTGAASGYVALLTDDGQENEVLFLEAGGMPCTVDPNLPMPIRGLRETAYRTHHAVYENDFMMSKWVKYMPTGHVTMRNVMFAPLNIDEKTVGIMGLANKPTDFTDEDAETAAHLGDLAAIALMNSRYLDAINQKTASLEKALAEVKTLRSLLPMCSHCRKVRDDDGLWSRLDKYILQHSGTQFTHGLCPDCIRELYPDEADSILTQMNSTDTAKDPT
ncbi:GAF domain-containing protein [Candidatus Bipolaricaulota bacterium]|nr:GAF domain-containing protein [Candidatus Bipolaricaulota bacterium]